MPFLTRLLEQKSIISIIVIAVLFTSWMIYLSVFQTKFDLSAFDLAQGEQIYNNTCIACHMTGHFGAPKVGMQQEWALRLEKGLEVLFNNSLKGLNAMPPKGGNAKLSDAEVKTAVAFMVAQSW